MFQRNFFLSALAATFLSACAVGEIGDVQSGSGVDDTLQIVPALSVSDGWRSVEASEPAFDTLEFELMARPTAWMDAGIALSSGDVADPSAAPIKVRFTKSGSIEAQNGDVWEKSAGLSYRPRKWYRIMISADLASGTYDVEVEQYTGPRQERLVKLITGVAFDANTSASASLTTWAAWSSEAAELEIAEVSWAASGTCAPTTCSSLGVECGEPSDGCGTTLGCGGCATGQTCDAGVCVCVAQSCSSLGVECGTMSDGCGGALSCGRCASNQVCDGGVCVAASSPLPPPCVPESCSSLGVECGTTSDGCGGTLSCGGCLSGQTCSGGACVCAPEGCSSLGVECGTASDGCGGTLSCGGCPSGQACSGSMCIDESSSLPPPCVPETCSSLALECGSESDGCGALLSCGGCTSGQVCNSGQCAPTGSQQFFASRTSCMAPCGVRFDGQPLENLSWAEVRDSQFVWDFDDGGAGSDGFIAAHMFEQPGTYNVSLTVDGTAWATTAITVSAPSRTVCVSPDSSFSACPSSSASDHFTSISAAYDAVGTNTHILLERGKSHGALPGNGAAGRSGAYLLGAYGSGAKPRVTSDSRRPRSGWTFQDLNVSTVGSTSYNFTTDAMDHVVFHRIDSTDGGRRFVSMFSQGPTNWMFFENNLVKGDYVMFACCTGLVVKGNILHRTGAYDGSYQHGLRVAGTDHALIQDNVFETDAPHTSLTLRGGEGAGRNGSDWVLVQGNTFDKHTQCHPANDKSGGIERHIVWEENNYNLDTVGGCSLCAAGAFTGHDQIIRNNIIGGTATGDLYEREHPLIENRNLQFVDNEMP